MLESVDELIDSLGGTAKVASLCGVGLSAVSNWRSRGRVPAEHFFIFEKSLETKGVRPDPAFFGFSATTGEQE